jgi:predicted ester cyclase
MTDSIQATSNITLATRFYDYLNGRAGDDWATIFAIDWSAIPPLPETPDQVSGYRIVIDQFRAGAPDLRVENVEVIANENVVAIRSRVSGTNTGELFGQRATGKPFSFTAMDVHRIADGKIIGTWHVEDFAGMMEQLS